MLEPYADANQGRRSAPGPDLAERNSCGRTASGGTRPRPVPERWPAGIRQPVQLPN